MRTPGSFGDVGQALALLGRTDDARTELARLKQLAKTRYVPALDIATVHASLGDREDAFLWLERALAEHSTNISMLEYDPTFARRPAVRQIDQSRRPAIRPHHPHR